MNQARMLTSVYLIMALAALLSGSIDALLIALNRRIGHGLRLGLRALFALAYIVLLAWLGCALQPRLLLMAVGAGALFSLVFRAWLNALRALPPTYMSTSNRYDSLWLRAAGALGMPAAFGHLACIGEGAMALGVAIIYTLL
jgi:hypothetical protein